MKDKELPGWEPVARIVTDGCGLMALVVGDTDRVLLEPVGCETQADIDKMVEAVREYLEEGLDL